MSRRERERAESRVRMCESVGQQKGVGGPECSVLSGWGLGSDQANRRRETGDCGRRRAGALGQFTGARPGGSPSLAELRLWRVGLEGEFCTRKERPALGIWLGVSFRFHKTETAVGTCLAETRLPLCVIRIK